MLFRNCFISISYNCTTKCIEQSYNRKDSHKAKLGDYFVMHRCVCTTDSVNSLWQASCSPTSCLFQLCSEGIKKKKNQIINKLAWILLQLEFRGSSKMLQEKFFCKRMINGERHWFPCRPRHLTVRKGFRNASCGNGQ